MPWFAVIIAAGFTMVSPAAADTARPGLPRSTEPAQILSVNPVHLFKGNITVGYERFLSRAATLKTTLSGATNQSYVFASVGLNRHLGRHNPVSYFAGLSVFGYESPIETGVPITSPFTEFFESDQDHYFAGLYLTNGVLFRVSRLVYVIIDAAAGPARDFAGKRWLAAWSINLNLGFPF